ncbi:isochorismatase family protein [Vibrio ichthyoenteri ATCC 700023]|uniref:Isochorismatase family protein n=1 Tax=Vibrio ichthyoenteri ATCC 700023 TaxID=870968 RepID=F9S0K5_9VIBR|nr:cysteine hydrolase family protein [Vibrio ichthyoenteri]EGU43183.1 isochorismatase family protein [Vibrio ichthyoenteri ATCC 700023]
MTKTALIIIDIQNDYFEGGAMPLHNPQAASHQAAKLIKHFRAQNKPVIHVQHLAASEALGFMLEGTKGQEIHPSVVPVAPEKVIIKHYPNSFAKTELESVLQALEVTEIIVAGMMTHMCVSSTVRASLEYGLQATVVHDACASCDLTILGQTIDADNVHVTALAEIANIAKISSCEEVLAHAFDNEA